MKKTKGKLENAKTKLCVKQGKFNKRKQQKKRKSRTKKRRRKASKMRRKGGRAVNEVETWTKKWIEEKQDEG